MTDFKSGVERIKALEDSKKAIQAQAQKNYTQANQTKAVVDAITTVGMVLLEFARNNVGKVEVTNPTAPTDFSELSTKLDALIQEQIVSSADTAMLDVLGEIKSLLETAAEPEEKPEGPEEVIVKNMIDYSECLRKIEELLGKEQPPVVFDPTIEVAPANVEVDFSEIKDEIGRLSEAFASFSVDIPAVDFSALVTAMEDVKSAIAAIVIPKPPNFVSSFKDSTGKSTSVELDADGRVPMSSPTYKLLLDDTSTANVTYVGKAAIGSATSSAVWQIQKIDETTGMQITWANNGLFTAKWTEILTETYT